MKQYINFFDGPDHRSEKPIYHTSIFGNFFGWYQTAKHPGAIWVVCDEEYLRTLICFIW
jgi:hypothetical protein